MMNIAGFDPGNSRCKWAVLEHMTGKGDWMATYDIPNITGDAIDLPLTLKGEAEELLAIERMTGAEQYRTPKFIGRLAMEQLQGLAAQDRDRHKAEGDGVNYIIPALLALESARRNVQYETWDIAVGATLSDFKKQAPEIERRLTGVHAVKFLAGPYAGRTLRANVGQVTVYPQAAAGAYGLMARTIPGTSLNLARQNVLVLDIGHGQINVALMHQMTPIIPACFSIDEGFYQVAVAVQEHLNAEHYLNLTIPQAQLAAENGHFMMHQESIPLGHVVAAAIDKIVKRVHETVVSRLGAAQFAGVEEILAIGGAAAPAAGSIERRFGIEPAVTQTSIYDNAIGLAYLARDKWLDRAKGGALHARA
jgi:hypothetical protein